MLTTLKPRPGTCYISQNRTVLAMRPDGWVAPEPHVGLFVCNTRLLSRYRYLIDGRPPRLSTMSAVEQNRWLGYYIVAPDGGGEPEQRSIELRISRVTGDGFHEDLDISNFTQQRVSLTLTLDVEADFADQRETDSPRRQTGTTHWAARSDVGTCELRADYHAEHRYDHAPESGVATFDAGVAVRVRAADASLSCEEGKIQFQIQLAPHASWHGCVEVLAFVCGRPLPLVYGCRRASGGAESVENPREVARETFHHRAARFSAPGDEPLSHAVIATVERAKQDLLALRLYDLDRDDGTWTVVAGLPTYVGLFGRDPLTVGTQAAMLTPDILAGTAAELPRWQGRAVDAFRDEQPGRMLHQVQTGPLSTLSFDPLGRSYASVTSSVFYPAAVSELWHWTGDRARVEALIEPALSALRWADRYGDIDGDGFYEYEPSSKYSLKNQGWKDSGDAIVHADGSQVGTPIATCEVQGFVYLSKLRMSGLLGWFNRWDEARRLFHEARELKKRFNDVFWRPDARYFAMGLDSRKHQIRSIASDPGLCLSAGIVAQTLAEPTATRLLAEDMFSGWGVRTLSSDHPAYDPYSYHRGTVWPVDQGAFALGFARYGLHQHVARLARGMFEAAALFEHHRLPECFAGHARDAEHPFPPLYPDADWPQAWSAASVFAMLQAMLGIYPFAPLHLLMVDPALPEWLPEITVANLHVGESVVDLRFLRDRQGGTQFEVKRRRGALHVVRQPSPWSLVAGPADRLRDLFSSLVR